MYSYIYRITNNINGKTYIGQHQYKNINDKYMGSGVHLIKARKKYGFSNFSKNILCHSISCNRTTNTIEKWLILKEKLIGKAEYNYASGGKKMWKHSKESKYKISNSLLGNNHAKGKNLGNGNAKGNILKEETRKKMGDSRKGNVNNGVSFIKCIETGKIMRVREWIDLGFINVHLVAKGLRKSCHGFSFEFYYENINSKIPV